MATRHSVRMIWDPLQGFKLDVVNFGCFYEHSPMIAAIPSYSSRIKKNVNILLGCFVVLDIIPWLGGVRRIKPSVAFAALLPLAGTCRLWEALVSAVNVNWQIWLTDPNPETWFSSPRLRTLTRVLPPPPLRSRTSAVLHVTKCSRPICPSIFEVPCPFDCQSYTVPSGHAPRRCEQKCCLGNLFVHPSPRHYHSALKRHQDSTLGPMASIVPTALTDPECGMLVRNVHRGLHPAPHSSQRLARPSVRPPVVSGVRRPIWNNDPAPKPKKWIFLPSWNQQSSSSSSSGTWYPPPPPPPPPPPLPVALSSQIESFSQDERDESRNKRPKCISGRFAI
jgi:hypothetical protein